jgi:hypothetical protein
LRLARLVVRPAIQREDEMEERKDKREERVEDLQVRDDEARDIAGGAKKREGRVAKKSRAGHVTGKLPIGRRDA